MTVASPSALLGFTVWWRAEGLKVWIDGFLVTVALVMENGLITWPPKKTVDMVASRVTFSLTAT